MNQTDSGGPVGTGEYVVKHGECLSSIALEHGFFHETLWNLPENSELKSKRKSPHILLEGDKVHIPAIRLKEESAPTDQKHRFKRRGVPSRLKLQVNDYLGKPRAGANYLLDVDGTKRTGQLDGSGFLDVAIPPNAKRAHLIIENGEEEFDITLGGTNPISELSGVQQRLNNLGYACGTPDGELNAATRSALLNFQRDHELEISGLPDDITLKELEKSHYS